MKRKIIILIIICLLLLGGAIGFIIYNNKMISTITLDINPSIEIKASKDDKVISVKALNNDAKDLITNDYKNKSINEVLTNISDKIIEKIDNEGKEYVILLHTEGKISTDKVSEKIYSLFEERNMAVNVIVPIVTKDDEKKAKELGITPAKAAYLNEVTKSNSNINIKEAKDKPISELKEMKETGLYCDEGYSLDGSTCTKEISKQAATFGNVCPNGYYDFEGICYEEVPSDETDKLLCNDSFELKDNNCVRIESIDAKPSKYSCPKGEAKTRYELGLTGQNDGDANDMVCVDLSNAKHPVSPCETNDGTEYTVSGGKCYWHRAPVIESGCPGKINVGGTCWDDASNILICEGYRDGKRYSSRSEYCEHSISYTSPNITEYECPDNYKLEGNKCIKEEIETPYHERTCKSGYTLVNNDRCINKNKTAEKETGYICDMPDSRLKGNECIILERIEAKSKEN